LKSDVFGRDDLNARIELLCSVGHALNYDQKAADSQEATQVIVFPSAIP
jgi:hypothetical protein